MGHISTDMPKSLRIFPQELPIFLVECYLKIRCCDKCAKIGAGGDGVDVKRGCYQIQLSKFLLS